MVSYLFIYIYSMCYFYSVMYHVMVFYGVMYYRVFACVYKIIRVFSPCPGVIA